MTKDIAPELIEQITAEYNKLVSEDKTLKTLLKKIKSKSATYKDVQEYAIRTSELLSKVLDNNLSSDILPDGRLYYNIATRIFNEVLGSNGLHGDISKYAAEVQKIINEKAGIGLKAVQAKVNEDRINGIVDVVSGKDNFDKIKYMVNEPIILYGISIADDTLKENFEFQSEAGLRPRIIRMPTSKCCDWCAERAGTFDYNEVIEMGNKVFQRHRFCRCIVEYDAGDGFRENVHTKKTRRVEEVEQRKRVGLETPLKKDGKVLTTATENIAKEKEGAIIELRNTLKKTEPNEIYDFFMESSYIYAALTPDEIKQELENAGYKVEPLGKGKLKGKTYETGGGYRVRFGKDGVFTYHPAQRSHHKKKAYYKISNGRKGTYRYDREGKEA